MLDFHSHFPSPDAIVCTATPIHEPGPSLLSFLGLLPENWTLELENSLIHNLESIDTFHLGEVGLDKRFAQILPLPTQVQVLHRLLNFAVSNNRKVTLHCVHATALMLKLLNEVKFQPFSVLWHGFTGSAETAAQLYKLKVVISLPPRGPFALTQNSPTQPSQPQIQHMSLVSRIFQANPMTVLETDYVGSNQKEYDMLLSNHYSHIAEELNVSVSDLEAHCLSVFKTFSGT